MAEEFQTGVCSGNWWNNMRTSSFDGSAVAVSAAGSSVSCSAGIDDMVSYGWTGTEIAESKTRSREDSSVSGSSVTFQDAHHKVAVTGGLLIDPSLPATAFGLSSPTVDWNHALLSNGRADHQNSFHAMLIQEELSSKPYFHHDSAASIASNNLVHMGVVEDMNQAFILDQHHLGSGNGSGDTTVNSFPIVSASFGGGPSMFMQGLFEPDLKPHLQRQSGYDHGSYHLSSNEMNQQNQPTWSKFPQLFKPSLPLPSPPKQQQQQVGQLHFSNNTAFWNAPAATAVNEPRPGFFPPVHTQFFPHGFEAKHNSTSTTTKPNSDGPRELSSATKKGCNEPAFKKPRVDTPSPLPTFKVRKEKLSDRITALQQLVSPFGKTDTASVLYEAIEYIKFLHDQVNVLSTPYLKNGHPMQHQQQQNSVKSKDVEGPKQDLRSRGLCLVPISSTFPVANEPTADFWNPTLGGSYR